MPKPKTTSGLNWFNCWPERVHYITHQDAEGEAQWATRPTTLEDLKRRRETAQAFTNPLSASTKIL